MLTEVVVPVPPDGFVAATIQPRHLERGGIEVQLNSKVEEIYNPEAVVRSSRVEGIEVGAVIIRDLDNCRKQIVAGQAYFLVPEVAIIAEWKDKDD